MPETIITPLPQSEVKIAFTVSPEEAKPYLDEAVKDLSISKPIPGFRPGKVTYEDAKRFYGEMAILEASLERLVRAIYIKTILSEQIDTVGSPAVAIDSLTPGQPIKFTITAPVAPTVTKFPDFSACQIMQKEVTIGEKEVTETVEEMRKMRRKEVRIDRAATEQDLVIIDLEMKRDQVLLEGGTGRDYRVYLAEPHYIPGFAEQLVGMKEGEERTFSLSFPEEHFQKHLAGKPVDFTAKATGVFELQLPNFDDEFAKGIGLDTAELLKEKLKENLTEEAQRKSNEAVEIELLEKLVDTASFSDIPDILLNEEIRRMIAELQQGVEEQGMKWDEYLSSLKKTPDELKLDFVPQATRRIRTSVLIKALAKQQNLTASEDELDTEVDRILLQLRPDDKETRERVTSTEYREYMAVQMRNRKALEWLKEQCIKK